ncbi:VCBS repeat-containing protein [Candidatus Poribacteria bacterium]|nr:VCBS repeat-containing protein [Candidatus Poribacteria bacterium]
MKPLVFRHQIIDPRTTGTKNDVCLVGDISGNGKNDIVVGSKYGENNLVWYENPTWKRHIIGTTHLEAGGVLVDITGNDKLDVVVGAPMDAPIGYTNTGLFWFENPDNSSERWKAHTITNKFRKYHDQAVGDIDGDGEIEIVFASQGAKVIAYFDIPDDPRVSPWPDDYCHIIAENTHVEGVVVVDIDGDGEAEVIAGPNIFKRKSDGSWERTELLADIDVRTCIAVGDLTGNGKPDIVLSEGELDKAKVIWLRNPDWKPTLLADNFFHPHSLEIADFDGNGMLDIFVGEMGLSGYPKAREVIYRNQGRGKFDMDIVGHYPTHCSRVADMTGNGFPDIIVKPYDSGNEQLELLINLGG